MFNQCAFVGRLGKDPEIKYLDGGKVKATFSIAVDRTFKRQGDPDADWFRVEIWGKEAENAAEWLKKGYVAAVGGRLELDTFDGRDGKVTVPTLKNATFKNLTPKEKAAATSAPAGGTPPADLDDDIPF